MNGGGSSSGNSNGVVDSIRHMHLQLEVSSEACRKSHHQEVALAPAVTLVEEMNAREGKKMQEEVMGLAARPKKSLIHGKSTLVLMRLCTRNMGHLIADAVSSS